MVSSFPQTRSSICEVTLRWRGSDGHGDDNPAEMTGCWGWEWGFQNPPETEVLAPAGSLHIPDVRQTHSPCS